jgi:hypothetical protein
MLVCTRGLELASASMRRVDWSLERLLLASGAVRHRSWGMCSVRGMFGSIGSVCGSLSLAACVVSNESGARRCGLEIISKLISGVQSVDVAVRRGKPVVVFVGVREEHVMACGWGPRGPFVGDGGRVVWRVV